MNMYMLGILFPLVLSTKFLFKGILFFSWLLPPNAYSKIRTRFVCTLDCFLHVPLEKISLMWRRHHAGDIDWCSAPEVFKQGGIFIVLHLLWHGTLIFVGKPWRDKGIVKKDEENRFKWTNCATISLRLVIRSLDLVSSHCISFPRFTNNELCKSRERFALRRNELCKSRERIKSFEWKNCSLRK